MNRISIYLPMGDIKYIYIDRAAAAAGRPAWMVRTERLKSLGPLAFYQGTRLEIYADESCGVLDCKGSKDAPLTPEGPAFWIETTAAVEVFE